MKNFILFICMTLYFPVFSQSDKLKINSIESHYIKFSPDGNTYAIAADDELFIYDSKTNGLLYNETVDLKRIYSIAFIPNSDELFIAGKSSSGKGDIIKLDYSFGKIESLFADSEQEYNEIVDVELNKFSDTIYFNTRSGEIFKLGLNDKKSHLIFNHANESFKVLRMAYNPVENVFSLSTEYGEVFLIRNGKLVDNFKIKFENTWIRTLAFDLTGKFLFVGNDEGKIRRIELNEPYKLMELKSTSKGNLSSCSISADNRYVAFSYSKGNIEIWSIEQNQIVKTYDLQERSYLYNVAFSPLGNKMLVVIQDSRKYFNFDVKFLGIEPIYRVKDVNDQTAPLIYVSSPPQIDNNEITYSKPFYPIKGSVVDESGVNSLVVNGITTPIKENGNFVINLPLSMGKNYVAIEATDVNGNTSVKRFVIQRENVINDDLNIKESENFLFVVGINDYKYWPILYNAVDDANTITNLLIAKYGFEYSNVKVLLNDQATSKNIYDELRALIEKVKPVDNLMIYYSGHGFYDELLNEGYWIPVNAEINAPGEYMSNSNLLKILNNINSMHTFLVVDACFSGSLFGQQKRGFVENVEKYKSRWGLASGRLETVSDGLYGENSPFAQEVINFLSNSDEKEIPVSQLVQHVKVEVANKTNQTPIGNPILGIGDQGGEFIFRKSDQ
ncbi:Caspase domain-containing protein [Marivirga sericea]|uniref:Caspase domain-containing protein n=1 Tax=Marivirga sericea TaxID=1028 RepID=A0A1X7L5N4_9BACT|nr:caspase family protein [Marivirga sericea]SMG48562.1 Caspase domain-containing protein [Marivirga sericea]